MEFINRKYLSRIVPIVSSPPPPRSVLSSLFLSLSSSSQGGGLQLDSFLLLDSFDLSAWLVGRESRL